jgi:hypothetical protein
MDGVGRHHFRYVVGCRRRGSVEKNPFFAAKPRFRNSEGEKKGGKGEKKRERRKERGKKDYCCC